MKIRAWKIAFGMPDAALQPLDLPAGVASLESMEGFLPQGAYTSLRTYHKDQVLRLSAHIQRLENSAALVDKTIELDIYLVRACLRKIVQTAAQDLRLRLVLDLSQHPGDLYFVVQTLQTPPPQAYQEGVKALTTDQIQRQLPKAKLTSFIAQADEHRRFLPAGIHETIMVDTNQQLLEGLSSNFFAVLNNVIHTAKHDVLSGTTRALVLGEIKHLGLPLKLCGVHLPELPLLSEAFITSASRAVLPLCQINRRPIGTSLPGEITKLLMDAYQNRVDQELERI